jgi:hypothetical protein
MIGASLKRVSIPFFPSGFALLNIYSVINLLTTYNGAYHTRALVKRHFLFAVKYGAEDHFVASLLTLRIQNNGVQFLAKSIIRSLEHALKYNNTVLALLLLPYLRPHFREVDPAHFQVRLTVYTNGKIKY